MSIGTPLMSLLAPLMRLGTPLMSITILVNEAENFINEAGNSINEVWILIKESGNSINEYHNSVNQSGNLILVTRPQTYKYRCFRVLFVNLVQHGVNKPTLRVRQFFMRGTPKTGLPHHSKSIKRLCCIHFDF